MFGSLTIRDYTPADWPAVCRVHDRARPMELLADPNLPTDHPIKTLSEVAEEEGFFKSRTAVAILNATLIGFASVDGAYLSFLYVDPGFHRRGVARALTIHVMPWVGPEGYTYASASNFPAIAFYQSIGMEIACRFPGEAEGIGGQCIRLAFPTSSHRHRPGKPTSLSLQLEAQRRGVAIDDLPREWPAEP